MRHLIFFFFLFFATISFSLTTYIYRSLNKSSNHICSLTQSPYPFYDIFTVHSLFLSLSFSISPQSPFYCIFSQKRTILINLDTRIHLNSNFLSDVIFQILTKQMEHFRSISRKCTKWEVNYFRLYLIVERAVYRQMQTLTHQVETNLSCSGIICNHFQHHSQN